MIAEIQKLEAAARVAMGHLEWPANAISAKPRYRFLRPAYALLALALTGLAFALR